MQEQGVYASPSITKLFLKPPSRGSTSLTRTSMRAGGDVKEQDCGEEQNQGKAKAIVKAMEQRAGIFGKGECMGGGGEG